MLESFDKMIFDMNEGMIHAGLQDPNRYMTGFDFIASAIVAIIIMIGFIEIVIKSDWYDEHREFFENKLPKIVISLGAFVILLVALYFQAYAQILFLTAWFNIVLIVATRKEFSGFRQWLDEKCGWLF